MPRRDHFYALTLHRNEVEKSEIHGDAWNNSSRFHLPKKLHPTTTSSNHRRTDRGCPVDMNQLLRTTSSSSSFRHKFLCFLFAFLLRERTTPQFVQHSLCGVCATTTPTTLSSVGICMRQCAEAPSAVRTKADSQMNNNCD